MPKFPFDCEIHAHVCSETAEQASQQLPLITPSQPGEMNYKAPGTAGISTVLAGSQRKKNQLCTGIAQPGTELGSVAQGGEAP